MRILLQILGFSLFMCGLSNCAGGKDVSLEQNPPFMVEKAYFQKWVAGVKGGGSGTKVHIGLKDIKEEIQVREIYFRDRVAEAKRDPQNIDVFSANFMDEGHNDIIMDGDTLNEAANTPPEKIPFTLKDDEAVIGYIHRGEIKYYKVAHLEEKPLIAYPSANKKGIE